MKTIYPLISCICITNSRPELLKKAIACFESQNYPNKELVISFPKNDVQTKTVIEEVLTAGNIRIYQIARHTADFVTDAKNDAIIKCTGDYICIWDEEDWCHSSRLMYQFNSMQSIGQGYKASILTRILLFDFVNKQAYISFPHAWDRSILCRKEVLTQDQHRRPGKEEDTRIIQSLSSRKLLLRIEDVPFLYIYVCHQWDCENFRYLLDKSQLLNEEVTEGIRKLMA